MAIYKTHQLVEELGISPHALRRRIKARKLGRKNGYYWELSDNDKRMLAVEIPRGWHGHRDNLDSIVPTNSTTESFDTLWDQS